jgi:signal peptidase I
MKRVVGLPGEEVKMNSEGTIFINGEKIERPTRLAHLKYLCYGFLSDDRSVECGAGYFVLGDDTVDSLDSRFEGPVPPDQLIGRAWYILAPSERKGPVLQ